ncbi:MAG: general secretion pathway protein G [Chlamydiales bacterium]|jgi:general secretion pathway protein G
MNKPKKRRRFMTLIEIMIVMFLISIIAGMVTYKVKGSIDYGKAFQTHQKIVQMKQILELAAIQKTPAYAQREWKVIVNRSLMSSKENALHTDGWGDAFRVAVKYNETDRNKIDVVISSTKFKDYIKHNDTWFEGEGE